MNLFNRTTLRSTVCALGLAVSALAAPVASATAIDFDGVSTRFWISSHSESSFDMARTNDGMGTLAGGYNEGYWQGNGSGRLLTWTNRGSQSGFTLSAASNEAFSLSSFDFANGYVSGRNAVTSVVLSGVLTGGGTLSETFVNSGGGWSTVALSPAWRGLSSVSFVAQGSRNRAVWDNLSLNQSAARGPVTASAPGTLAIFGIGLITLAIVRRRSLARRA